MGSGNRRGADLLTQAMAHAGVRRIFTLSGNHIMPVFDAALDAGIELIHVRHEAAAVHMADAWGRLTGEPGIALVTGGPGHANAVGALYTAAMAESPLILLSGHAPRDQLGMGAFQEMRQADIAAPLTKRSSTSESASSVADDFARAWRHARSSAPGPVHLSLPADCLEGETEAVPPEGDAFAVEVVAIDEQRAREWVARLRAAKRPMILAAPRFLTRRGRTNLAALEGALGVPVVGMESPRGVADPSLGAFAEVLARADTVLLLGKPLDFTLKFGRAMAADCERVVVEPELASAAVGALLRHASDMRTSWLDEVRSAIAYRPTAWDQAAGSDGRLHPVQALRPLQAILDEHPDAVFVSDGGEVGQWAQGCLTAPHRVINGVAGSIGAALPFALAARVAQPEAPVIAVMGDGTFGFHPAEIDTAVRHRLPFVAIVANDARWNAEYQIQLRDYGRERLVGCELLPTRYDQVAVAFGGYGELVTSPVELLPAARRAIAAKLPAVLNVMIEGLPAPNLRRGP